MYTTAVVLVSVALAQPPAAATTPPGSDYIPINSRKLKIPIKYERDRRHVRLMKLFVTRAGDNTWYQEAAVPPDRDHFDFYAKEDGLYWLTMVEEDLQGRQVPADLTRHPPDLKVLIDATPPVVRFTAVQRQGEELVVEWRIEDAHPAESRTQVHVRPAGSDGPWQEVRLAPGSPFGVRFAVPTNQALEVRVTAYDLAGNRGEAVQVIPAAGVTPAAATTSPAGGTPTSGATASGTLTSGATSGVPPGGGTAPSGTVPAAAPPGLSPAGALPLGPIPPPAPLAPPGAPIPPANWAPPAANLTPPANLASPPANPVSPPAYPASSANPVPPLANMTPPTGPPPANMAVPATSSAPVSPPAATTPAPAGTAARERPLPTLEPAAAHAAAAQAFWTHGTVTHGVPTHAPTPAVEESRTAIINYLSFDLGYEVETRGPSGLSRIDLWVTRDDGQTWMKWSQHPPKGNTLRVQLNVPSNPQLEGTYGFRIVPVSGAGLSEREPVSGDPPELRVMVDLTPPQVELYPPVGDPQQPGVLVLQWKVTDKNLDKSPLLLEWSDKPTGPWQPVASSGASAELVPVSGAATPASGWLPNTGSYPWRVPMGLPPRVYLKLTARDAAGNVREVVTRDPILIDLVKPKARLSGIVGPAATRE